MNDYCEHCGQEIETEDNWDGVFKIPDTPMGQMMRVWIERNLEQGMTLASRVDQDPGVTGKPITFTRYKPLERTGGF